MFENLLHRFKGHSPAVLREDRLPVRVLRDESGASIMFALLFFLIAIVVSIIILTAASVTSGQLQNLEQDQRARLSAGSAAETLAELLNGATCDISGSDGNAEVQCALSSAANSSKVNEATANGGSTVDSLAALVATMVRDVVISTGSGPGSAAYATIKLSVPSQGEVEDVVVKMRMAVNYDIQCTCTAGESVVECHVPAAHDGSAAEAPTQIRWMKGTIVRPSVNVGEGGGSQ